MSKFVEVERNVYYDMESPIFCSICGETFTAGEWDERHTTSDGEDCHADCCDVCAAEEDDEDDEDVEIVNPVVPF